jgi:hypothetical protein
MPFDGGKRDETGPVSLQLPGWQQEVGECGAV